MRSATTTFLAIKDLPPKHSFAIFFEGQAPNDVRLGLQFLDLCVTRRALLAAMLNMAT